MDAAPIIRIPVTELAPGHTLVDGAGDRWYVTGVRVNPDMYSSTITFNYTCAVRYLWDDEVSVITNGCPLASDR
jgi:hypothetical protein